MIEKSSWQHRTEYYEKEYHKLVKAVLKIQDMTHDPKIEKYIESLNLVSGWNGKDNTSDSE